MVKITEEGTLHHGGLLRTKTDLEGAREKALAAALRLLLDQVDYTQGNCRPNEMVGAVLDEAVIRRVRAVLADVS